MMKNTTKIRIPKKYEKYINEVWSEQYAGDGYWADLKECCLCDDTGSHYVHEWTVKDFLASLKSIKVMTIDEYHRLYDADDDYYADLEEVQNYGVSRET